MHTTVGTVCSRHELVLDKASKLDTLFHVLVLHVLEHDVTL